MRNLIEPGLNYDVPHQQSFKEEIRIAIRSKTLAEWTEIFANYDACVEPVLSTHEALAHPHTQARQMVVEVPRPTGTVQQQVGTPIKLSGHVPDYKHVGVKLGANTAVVLTELGYSQAEIAQLEADGVVATG